MQVFKGRDAQQLERLAAAPSSWRVLNLAHATRTLRDAGAPSQLRFFQTHQLNNALFAKHTLRDHERAMFVTAPAVATKLLIPLDRYSFSHGALSVFVGERGYDVAMRQWLGLKVGRDTDPAKVSPDAAILFMLSQMPAFGRDEILQKNEISDVVSHVRVISGQDKPSAAATRGAALFEANCAVCHGAAGKGNRELGAPNLSDAIWLYGGDRATLTTTIVNARGGVMPAWGARLDPVTIKMLAAYVHSLGGGEANPVVAIAAAEPEVTSQ